jgi:hypothetical protein
MRKTSRIMIILALGTSLVTLELLGIHSLNRMTDELSAIGLRVAGNFVQAAQVVSVLAQLQTPDNRSATPAKTYANSRTGIEQQFADILSVVRTNDQPAIQQALDTLGILDANAWIAAHFAPAAAAQEQQAYQQGLKAFQSHVWWVTGNFGVHPDFSLNVEESQKAPPLSTVGFEGLVPRPKDSIEIQNYRFTSNVTDPKLGKPSWVNSFTYLDGRFRMLGGTFPFWAEGLNATRGPMSLPPEVIRGRTIQAAAFRSDKVQPGIDAIAHIEIEVKRDGNVKKMKVLSGDEPFIADAKQYLQEADFGAMPDDPRLQDAKRVWDMEVVFFTPATTSPANP